MLYCAQLWHPLCATPFQGMLEGQTVVASDENWEEAKQWLNAGLATNGPQLFYISSAVCHSAFCLCILFTWTVCFLFFFVSCWFFGGCVLLASSELSDGSGKKRLLCSEGFCAVVKKPLHFLYVQHGRAQNEHAESWLKFTDLQNSLSSPPSPPHPLGLEVMAACDKKGSLIYQCPFSYSSCVLKIPKSAWIFHFRGKICP